MSKDTHQQVAFDTLKIIFKDRPDLLEIITPSDLASQEWLEKLRGDNGIFASPIKQYAVGRTHAGKTTLGNRFLGQEIMRTTGHTNCTDYIGLLRLKGNLWYVDTPGAGSDEDYENITRAALSLKQLPDGMVDEFEIYDFTEATGKNQGIEKRRVTLEEWDREKGKFVPDVILFTVAPHMLFLRGDREYLEALLSVSSYVDKIVFAFNIWQNGTQATTEAHIEDAQKKIKEVYQKVLPGQGISPTFVIVNARTGAGIDQLTAEICARIPAEKLGKMHAVLKEELKNIAEKTQNRRFQQVLHRIAARLALHTVDQRLGDEHLMTIAASGIIEYTVMTFKNADELLAIQHALSTTIIEPRMEEIRAQRSEDITRREYKTAFRPIEVQRAVIKEDIIEQDIPYHEAKTSTSRVKKPGLERFAVWLGGQGKKLDSFFDRGDTRGFKEIDQQTAERMYTEHTNVTFEEKTRTMQFRQQRLDGYETNVAAYVNEIVGFEDKVVGQKSLAAGFPLIEFLIGLGLGVKHACQDTSGQMDGLSHIVASIKTTQAQLLSCRPRIEALIEQRGQTAEEEIVRLLDQQLISN